MSINVKLAKRSLKAAHNGNTTTDALGPRTFPCIASSPKFPQRAPQWLIQEVTKESRRTSTELQPSLVSVEVNVRDSTIRKTPLLTKNAHLTFAIKKKKKHPDDLQDFWDHILWTDEAKVKLFGRPGSCYISSDSLLCAQLANLILGMQLKLFWHVYSSVFLSTLVC